MPKFSVCPECQGTGSSSAYLGAFTHDDLMEQGEDFIEDYIGGAYDRKCDHCNGLRVVKGCKISGCTEEVAVVHSIWSGRHEYEFCFTHSDEAQDDAECQAQSAAERAFGA